MPTYNYRCKICEYEFEAVHRMDDDYPSCPNCKEEVKRIIVSSPTVKFVGSGFYSNDSRLKKQPSEPPIGKDHAGNEIVGKKNK